MRSLLVGALSPEMIDDEPTFFQALSAGRGALKPVESLLLCGSSFSGPSSRQMLGLTLLISYMKAGGQIGAAMKFLYELLLVEWNIPLWKTRVDKPAPFAWEHTDVALKVPQLVVQRELRYLRRDAAVRGVNCDHHSELQV